jgi:hypothetical protein
LGGNGFGRPAPFRYQRICKGTLHGQSIPWNIKDQFTTSHDHVLHQSVESNTNQFMNKNKPTKLIPSTQYKPSQYALITKHLQIFQYGLPKMNINKPRFLPTIRQKHLSGHTAMLHGSLNLRDHSSVAQIPVPGKPQAKLKFSFWTHAI